MARSARRPERAARRRGPGAALLALVSRHPVFVASGAAFALTLGAVSANALWLQPQRHPSALFATRLPATRETVAEPAAPRPDPVLQSVQATLNELGHYSGAVDGLDGPATRAAIARFQAEAGLSASGHVDRALLVALDRARSPELASSEQASFEHPSSEQTGDIARIPPRGAPDIRKLQAGLRAFGNEEVSVDGVLGARTRDGVRRFQAMFGLPETGEPESAVFAKMKEIGLTD